jgi:hypothetical protein
MFLLIHEFPISVQSAQIPLALQFIKFDVQTQMNPFISGSTLFARFHHPDAMNRLRKLSQLASLLSMLDRNTIIIPVEYRQIRSSMY